MEAYLTLNLARQQANDGTRPHFRVESEMAVPRPALPGSNSKRHLRKDEPEVTVDLEVVVVPGPATRWCFRFLPAIICMLVTSASVCNFVDEMNSRWSSVKQKQYAHFAYAHGEHFHPSMMPDIFRVVDTLKSYRDVQEAASGQDGVISFNSTPDHKWYDTASGEERKTMKLLAIGSAKCTAEALRYEDSRPWGLFVPRCDAELMAFQGKSFVDSIIIAGEVRAFYCPSKDAHKIYKFLHDEGVVVHHVPVNVNPFLVKLAYKQAFGNARLEQFPNGSCLITATKKNIKLPEGGFNRSLEPFTYIVE